MDHPYTNGVAPRKNSHVISGYSILSKDINEDKRINYTTEQKEMIQGFKFGLNK